MYSNPSILHVSQQQIPVFLKGGSYESWSIKMKTFLKSEGLWDFVEKDYSDDEVRSKDNQMQDAKALFFIQQAVDESNFSIVAAATSANKAWSLLETDYQRSNKELIQTCGVADEDVCIAVKSLSELIKGACLSEENLINGPKQEKPSIHMVPRILKDHNETFFSPRMVSIGPLHREDKNLQASEKEKATYVDELLTSVCEKENGTNVEKNKILEACMQKLIESIDNIRSSYAETISYNNIELAKMMFMDGCFILGFLYKIFKGEPSIQNVTFLQYTYYDLVLLENQIPFIVLENIFECTIKNIDKKISLIDILYVVLNHVNPFKDRPRKRSSNITHDHILGLLHECYQTDKAKSGKTPESRFPSAVELDRAGVNFKRARDTEWALVIDVTKRKLPCFSIPWGRPTLVMPLLEINDFTELVLRNLMVYELYYENLKQFITSYAIAIDMLVDNEEDIAMLVKSKILVNNIGSNQEAADMINRICKEVAWRDFFYSKQWEYLTTHYNGYWSKYIAWLRRTYFNNPWNIIALLAGIFLFVLTVVQTIYTVNPVGSD